MEALIPIRDHEGQKVVSARELHEFLESKKDFSNWIKQRIQKYGLVENQDYVSFAQKGEREKGGTVRIEYALTLDAAKELSMVEGNSKGKEARLYFLECERQMKQPRLPSTKELAMMVVKAEDEKEQALLQLEQANKTIQEQGPMIEYVTKVLDSDSVFTTTTIAKELDMAAPTLNKKLYELGIQYYADGHWVLYAQYQNKGYTKTRTHSYYDKENNQHTSIQTVWTEKGRQFIHTKMNRALKTTPPVKINSFR